MIQSIAMGFILGIGIGFFVFPLIEPMCAKINKWAKGCDHRGKILSYDWTDTTRCADCGVIWPKET